MVARAHLTPRRHPLSRSRFVRAVHFIVAARGIFRYFHCLRQVIVSGPHGQGLHCSI